MVFETYQAGPNAYKGARYLVSSEEPPPSPLRIDVHIIFRVFKESLHIAVVTEPSSFLTIRRLGKLLSIALLHSIALVGGIILKLDQYSRIVS